MSKSYLRCYALLMLCLLALAGCERKPVPGLLAGLSPSRFEHVNHPERITDGVKATTGDSWDTDATSTFANPAGFVEYDLGRVTRISALFVQGDNNDEYVFEGSTDGKSYSPLWVAPPTFATGMQGRENGAIRASVRYLRVSGRGGDNYYSIGELQAYSDPSGLGVGTTGFMNRGLPGPESVRGLTMMFVFAVTAWLFLNWRYSPSLWTFGTALIPAWYGYHLYTLMVAAWPLGMREVSFIRGAAAALAGLTILRELVFKRGFPALRWTINGTLGLSAALAFLSFFNLGEPQFRDANDNEPLFVHNFDMRVYYPVAKYFNELRYDGLYLASVAAYVADDPNVHLDSLGEVQLRDLKTHRGTRVALVKSQIEAIPKRFSDARWEAFKTDMRYFRQTMGVRDYLGSMMDHGGNATPVWMAIAHILFAGTTASNATLTMTGLLDPLMLLVAFFAIYRAFGLRTALVSAVVFGANDFYMFGSNWGGATLRHDWMVYLAVGLCALKLGRFRLGGALLALSAAIRAFPALALVGIGLALGWQIWAYYRDNGAWPTYRHLVDHHEPIVKTLIGAAACTVAVLLFSSLVFDPAAWAEWLHKVSILDRDPHINDVNLRAAIAGVSSLQPAGLHQRAPLHYSMIGLYVLLVGVAIRNKPLDQAAALATMLIPVLFNPANYYAHFIFVLPVLAVERARADQASGKAPLSGYDGWIWGTLLLLCVALYWTTLTTDLELHFEEASQLLCSAFLAILVLVLYRDRSVWLPPSTRQSLCWLLRRNKR